MGSFWVAAAFGGESGHQKLEWSRQMLTDAVEKGLVILIEQ